MRARRGMQNVKRHTENNQHVVNEWCCVPTSWQSIEHDEKRLNLIKRIKFSLLACTARNNHAIKCEENSFEE